MKRFLLSLLVSPLLVCAAAQALEEKAAAPTALLDEIWNELSRNDPFFDPNAASIRAIYTEHSARLLEISDPTGRLREVIRALSRLRDGHLSLTTRWFLPDRPAPPLPLAGDEPLYRPAIGFDRFHGRYYLWLDFSDSKDDTVSPSNGRAENAPETKREFCRVLEIDGALVPYGGAWSMLNGPEGSSVELHLERPNGAKFKLRLPRTQLVEPPAFFAPTTQRVVIDPETGEETVQEEEVVIESRRLPGNLGYIRVEHLVKVQVVRDFNAALDRLMDTDGLILDLRDTGGGYPWIMLPIAGRFYETYTRVARFSTRTSGLREVLQTLGALGVPAWRPTYTKPLVVLTNEGTGSMSEGLTFALGDTGRAYVIGRPTKGLNAAIRNTTLNNGLVLRHSWIRTDRLGRRKNYQGTGVEPNERVEVTAADVQRLGLHEAKALENRLQFERAVEKLQELIRAK